MRTFFFVEKPCASLTEVRRRYRQWSGLFVAHAAGFALYTAVDSAFWCWRWGSSVLVHVRWSFRCELQPISRLNSVGPVVNIRVDVAVSHVSRTVLVYVFFVGMALTS